MGRDFASITSDDFDDEQVLMDPEIMDFEDFEDYIMDCEETDFFVIMPEIYPTLKFLINKGVSQTEIYVWMGNLNKNLRGRIPLWHKAFVASDTGNNIQNILDSLDDLDDEE